MIAVLDACVIYPSALRDILMWLAVVGVYEPRWTDDIHAEWMRNVLKDNPEMDLSDWSEHADSWTRSTLAAL